MRIPTTLILALVLPALIAAKGDGCAANSRAPAPDVSGSWDIDYDETLDATIRIGGAVYEERLGIEGGVVDIVHDGRRLSFNLDCARPEVICPSEAWPESVRIEQRNVQLEHRMIVTLPVHECSGATRAPGPEECGEGTSNPDCEDLCEGELRVNEAERFGVIGASGESFRLYLGAGVVTSGVGCALLGISLADADLSSQGNPEDGTWRAQSMEAGLVTLGYGGACLWGGDPDADAELEALVLASSIEFRTGFRGQRQ